MESDSRTGRHKAGTAGDVMATLKEGDKAPEFRLRADDGKEIALADQRGKNVIFYFYPKALTPG